MKLLVTGAGGLLGSAIVEEARTRGHPVVALAHADLDITDGAAVARAVAAARPEAVLHCAAFTAVDRAESEPERAEAVNVRGTKHVAEAAAAAGAIMVYVSTDYVFDGKKRTPYLPDDEPGPLSVYARTKLAGERAVEAAGGAWLIVRTSWLYGTGKGFAPSMLRRARGGEALRVVDDQRGRPTWVPNAARAVLDLLAVGARGITHVADQGDCTPYELAREALALEGVEADLEAVSTLVFGAPARRPAYSVLDLEATEERLGRRLPGWREGLRSFLGLEVAQARNGG